jgi:hypothetical protein
VALRRGARERRSVPSASASYSTARARLRAAIEDHFGAVEEIDCDAVTAEVMADTGETGFG